MKPIRDAENIWPASIKEGKSLTMSIKGRQGISSRGLFHQPGSSGNLPTGEAYIAPVEGTAEGEIIIDGSIAKIGVLKAPLHVNVEKGLAVNFKGPDGVRLENILGPNKNARNIGELGIGTNPMAGAAALSTIQRNLPGFRNYMVPWKS